MADLRVRVVFAFSSKMQHCQIRCLGCRRVVILPPEMAVELFGAMTHVDQLEKRLVCSHCGAKRARVSGVYREYHG